MMTSILTMLGEYLRLLQCIPIQQFPEFVIKEAQYTVTVLVWYRGTIE